MKLFLIEIMERLNYSTSEISLDLA